MSELDPKTFSFDDFFADAHPPTESADIFTRADVIGDIRELERRIELEAATVEPAPEGNPDELTLAQKPAKPNAKLAKLTAERNRLFKQFEGSKITVHVKALTGTQRQNILDAHNATEPKEPNEEFVFRILSASIIAMQKAGQDKTGATLTIDEVRNLYGLIGDMQINVIHNAYKQATMAAPEVSADFLPGPSSPETTAE